jgi:hypothetical protein
LLVFRVFASFFVRALVLLVLRIVILRVVLSHVLVDDALGFG